MSSFRDFIKGTLLKKLETDVKQLRILNEADLQYRTAVYLDKQYHQKYRLTNQPTIRIGRARGTDKARPDIVIYHPEDGVQIAVELKCFMNSDTITIGTIVDQVGEDIDKLRKFKDRHANSKNAFAIVLVDLKTDDYKELLKEFKRLRQAWTKHYLYIHTLNVRCAEDYRKRHWYDNWKQKKSKSDALLCGRKSEK